LHCIYRLVRLNCSGAFVYCVTWFFLSVMIVGRGNLSESTISFWHLATLRKKRAPRTFLLSSSWGRFLDGGISTDPRARRRQSRHGIRSVYERRFVTDTVRHRGNDRRDYPLVNNCQRWLYIWLFFLCRFGLIDPSDGVHSVVPLVEHGNWTEVEKSAVLFPSGNRQVHWSCWSGRSYGHLTSLSPLSFIFRHLEDTN